MKTIKIIDIQKVCNGCKFDTPSLCDKGMQDIVSCEEGKEDASVIEQVPETFEDVKQLTKEHIEKLKLNKDVWEIDIQKDFIDIQKKYVTYRVRFTSIGNILFDAYLKIAENKTPNELWSFIKSLIGEE